MTEIDWPTIEGKVHTQLGSTVTCSQATHFTAPNEIWFSANLPKEEGVAFRKSVRCVYSCGELFAAATRTVPPSVIARARHVLYHYGESLFVEFVDYGAAGGIVTFAVDNGSYTGYPCDPGTFATRIAHYARIGFVRVGAWHLYSERVVVRNFVGPERRCATVRLDGTIVQAGQLKQAYPDRDSAEAAMEPALADLASKGYQCRQIESMTSRGDNPPDVTPLQLPTLQVWPEPASARDAVDQAVARARELHNVFPSGNMILELLKLPEDQSRMENLGGGHFPRWYPYRLGRWNKLPPKDAEEPTANSFEYLLQRYGTFTWSVHTPWIPPPVHTFNDGNMHGGARCVMAIESDAYNALEAMSGALGEPDVVKLRVFDGGWAQAFDTRFTSKEGEHPIVCFDESEPSFFEDSDEEIEPFGYWLLSDVKDIIEGLLPWLARINQSDCTAVKGSDVKDSAATAHLAPVSSKKG